MSKKYLDDIAYHLKQFIPDAAPITTTNAVVIANVGMGDTLTITLLSEGWVVVAITEPIVTHGQSGCMLSKRFRSDQAKAIASRAGKMWTDFQNMRENWK